MASRTTWREVLRPPLTGLAAVILIAVLAALVVGHAGVWRNTVSKRDGQDFGIFLTSVRHAVAGRSLYTPTRYRSVTARRSITGPPNLNLPHTLVLLLPLARLPTWLALTVWMAASFAALAAASIHSLRVLRWRMPPLAALALVVYLVAWAPAAAFTLTAQISLLLMYPTCRAWLAYRTGRSATAGVWIGIAAAIKPFLFLFAPYFLIRRDWAALRAMAATAGGFLLLGLLVFGPWAYVEWLQQLPRVSWAGHYLNASWLSLVHRVFGASDYPPVLAQPGLVAPLALALSAATGVWTLSRVTRTGGAPEAIDADWAALTLAALLMSPLGWSYYVWIALWPVAALIGHERPWRRRRAADAALVLGLGGWLWWGKMAEWGQPHGLATLTATSMYVWALAALWLWVLRTRSDPFGPAGPVRTR